MKLDIGDKIRKYRRDTELTQDEFAEKLGVSEQAVSRWECGTAYPDLEMIPLIAGFFGVSTDELLGVLEILRDARVKRYWDEFENLTDTDEKIALLRSAWTEFPYEYEFAKRLCILLNRNPENYGEVISISKEVLGKCFVGSERWWFIRFIVLDEEGDAVYDFIDKNVADAKISSNSPMRRDLIRQRYRWRGEYELWAKINQFDRIQNILTALQAATPRNDIDVIHATLEYINALAGVDEKVRREHPVLGDGVPDLWLDVRVINGLRLSNRLGNIGKTDEALDILEDVVEVCERFFTLPTGSILSYKTGSPYAFDAEITNEDHVVNASFIEHIGLEKEGKPETLPPFKIDGYLECMDTDAWEWSDEMRKSPRFTACVDRIRALT